MRIQNLLSRAIFGALALACWSLSSRQFLPTAFGQTLPRPDHVVIVIEENKAYSQVIGQIDPTTGAPYINQLAAQGALFTSSYAIGHPSQNNYFDFFSGSDQGFPHDDSRPPAKFTTPNLGAELIAKGLTFGGYSESMPSVGFDGDYYTTDPLHAQYSRLANPWVNWQDSTANAVPAADNMPLTYFPTDYSLLPTVSFVIPNMQDNMHDGTINKGDQWLKSRLDGYVQWAKTHNSLLIVTWDEDDFTTVNQIPTFFVGPMVRPGQYGETINHHNVLRTIEDLFGTGYAGASDTATPITDAFLPQHFMAWNKGASGNWSESHWTHAPPAFPNATTDPALNTHYTVTVDGPRVVRSLLVSDGMIDVPAGTALTTITETKVGPAGTLHIAGVFSAETLSNDGLFSLTNHGQAVVSTLHGTGVTTLSGDALLSANSLQQTSLSIGVPPPPLPFALAGGTTPIPEPSTLALSLVAAIGLLLFRRQRV
jgi:phosphatidylinositol-3-phosphatase